MWGKVGENMIRRQRHPNTQDLEEKRNGLIFRFCMTFLVGRAGGGCCLWVTVRIKGVFCEFEKLNNGSGKLKGS